MSASAASARQHFVHRPIVVAQGDSQVQRRVGLRIEIHQADTLPARRQAAERLTAVVVLPTPPFWLMTAMERMERNSFSERVREHPTTSAVPAHRNTARLIDRNAA